MKTQNSFSRKAIILVCAVASLVAFGAAVPQQANAARPESQVAEQVQFLLSKQLPSGAITSIDNKISPYFANVAAVGLIKANTKDSKSGALAWMTWYLDHLNTPSTNVPANSVFDYIVEPGTGREVPTGDFDSVDSYASTALNVANAAVHSHDHALRQFVRDHINQYESIANLLTVGAPSGVLVESGPDAGLTIAKPSYAVAYTMDNVEVFSGLRDFSSAEGSLTRSAESATYAAKATSAQKAVVAKLWNPSNNNWDWAYANASDPKIFYAQATVQVWPILFGVVAPKDPKAVAGWNQFNSTWPSWFNNGVPDAYPWSSLARAAQIMGEPGKASAALADIHNRYAPTFTQPTQCGVASCGQWYSNEAGWFIQSVLAEAKR